MLPDFIHKMAKNTGNASQCRLSNTTLLVSSVISIMQPGEGHHAAYKAVRVRATETQPLFLPSFCFQCTLSNTFAGKDLEATVADVRLLNTDNQH